MGLSKLSGGLSVGSRIERWGGERAGQGRGKWRVSSCRGFGIA